MPESPNTEIRPWRELLTENEKKDWSATLGRVVWVPRPPDSLTDRVIENLVQSNLRPVYIPPISPGTTVTLNEIGPTAFVDEIQNNNPNVVKNSSEVEFLTRLYILSAEEDSGFVHDTKGKWAAIETWPELTSHQVDFLPDRRSTMLADARYYLPASRYLWGHVKFDRDIERGKDAKQLHNNVQSIVFKNNLAQGAAITLPGAFDLFLLSQRGIIKNAIDTEEWTSSKYRTSGNDFRYLVVNMNYLAPKFRVCESGDASFGVGLRPMLQFESSAQ